MCPLYYSFNFCMLVNFHAKNIGKKNILVTSVLINITHFTKIWTENQGSPDIYRKPRKLRKRS